MENGRMGLFGAFPGTSFTALINLSWACPVFGVIPAPVGYLGFGAVRRAYVGLLHLQDGFVVLFYSYFGRGLKRSAKRWFLGGHSLLDLIELKCRQNRELYA